MIKKYLMPLTFFILLLMPCFLSAKQTKETASSYVANFSYIPDSVKPRGSGGATFAVSGPVYVSDDKTTSGADWRQSPQFSLLSAAIKEDVPELLIARGFNVRGPFDSYDLVPYSEKKNIDFYVIPVVELFATWKNTTVEAEGGGFSTKVYHGTGTIEVTGSLTIKLQEMMTREQVWSKSVPISYSFPYDIRFPYFTKGTRPFDMNLVMDDMAKGLEQQYPAAMKTLANLMDSEEMRMVKRQALELKKKKGY